MTSKEVIQTYFPGAKCIPSANGLNFFIEWSGEVLPKPEIMGMESEDDAWNACVKHRVTRERFLALHHGKLVKFLDAIDKVELITKPVDPLTGEQVLVSKATEPTFDQNIDTSNNEIKTEKIDVTARDW